MSDAQQQKKDDPDFEIPTTECPYDTTSQAVYRWAFTLVLSFFFANGFALFCMYLTVEKPIIDARRVFKSNNQKEE